MLCDTDPLSLQKTPPLFYALLSRGINSSTSFWTVTCLFISISRKTYTANTFETINIPKVSGKKEERSVV